MKNVGEIFKKTRVEKNLTLEEVEKKTKIRAKFLKALEENDWEKIPSPVYTRGFIKNYSEFLGISPEKILAIFRRQFDEKKELGLLPRGLTANLKNKPFPPKASQVIAIFFLLPLVLFFAYLFREYRSFVQPPRLLIQSPQEKMVTADNFLEVRGQTDPEVTLTLNSQKISLNEDGSFNQKITLTPGLNTLEFVAKNKLGREKRIEQLVTFRP